MLHSVFHTLHSQNTSFKTLDGGPKWPPAADIKRSNANHSKHHFLSTFLLQELAQIESDCRRLGLILKFDYVLPEHNKSQIDLNMWSKVTKINQN